MWLQQKFKITTCLGLPFFEYIDSVFDYSFYYLMFFCYLINNSNKLLLKQYQQNIKVRINI